MKNHEISDKLRVELTESRGTERENYLDSLRANVRAYMNECAYTADELAEICDVPVSTFRDFLYGNTATVKLTPVIRLAKEFGISIDELIGCDTIPRENKETMQILRRLPEHFNYFYNWNIRATARQRSILESKHKSVNLSRPLCANGGLKPTNTFELLDISYLPLETRAKIFFAVKIPCEHYMPAYSPYHALLIAHDRKPENGEHCIVASSGMLWILSRHEEDGKVIYKSVRDGKFRCYEDDIDELVGYVAGTHILEKRD